MKKAFTHSLRALAAGCLLMLAQAASAQTTYTTIANGDWSNTLTWDAFGVPEPTMFSGDIVNVGHNVTMDASPDLEFATMNINSTKTLTIPNGQGLSMKTNGVLNIDGTLQNDGIVTGNGMINQNGSFSNSSTSFINPGSDLGKLTVMGNLNLGSGTTNFDINGTVQETDYDWLAVSGTATLDPTAGTGSKLNVTFGYNAAVNDFFDILTATTVGGTFDIGNISFSGGYVSGISVTYPIGDKVRVTVTSVSTTTYTTIANGNWNNFEIWDLMVVPPNPLPSGDIINVGHVVLMTGDITINNGATLNINSGGDLNDGMNFQFAIYNSGTLTNNGILFPGNGLQNDNTFTNNGTLTEPFLINNSPMTNNGTANIGFDSHNYSTFTNSGTGILNINEYTNNQPGGTLINNGTMTTNSGFDNNGTVKGTGTIVQIGGFSNSSTSSIAPGNSAGKLTVTGDFDLGASTYNCEINGIVQETDYDWLAVSGTATIGVSSTLELNFYNPIFNGTTFDVLTAGIALSGSYTSGNITFINNIGGNVTAVSVMNVGNIVRVTVTTPLVLLPVELVSFTGKTKEGGVLLQWETASEQNNEGFQIERSTDGERWNNLGFVAGHGTTGEAQSYTYTDERPLPGPNYYRLLQIDYDGQSEYSKIVSVEMKNGGSGIHFYPNPVSYEDVTVLITVTEAQRYAIKVSDLSGYVIAEDRLDLEAGQHSYLIPNKIISNGMYFVQIQNQDGELFIRKFVKTKE